MPFASCPSNRAAYTVVFGFLFRKLYFLVDVGEAERAADRRKRKRVLEMDVFGEEPLEGALADIVFNKNFGLGNHDIVIPRFNSSVKRGSLPCRSNSGVEGESTSTRTVGFVSVSMSVSINCGSPQIAATSG